VNFVSRLDRAGRGSAVYAFTLPPSWTTGKISLTATIKLEPSFGHPVSRDCCPDNDSFTLTDIPFTPTRDLFFAVAALRVNAGPLNYPNIVFEDARNLLPIGDTQFHMGDYDMEIDITDIWNQNDACGGFPLPFSPCPIALDDVGRAHLVSARLRDVANDFNFDESGDLVGGIFPQSVSDRIRSMESKACSGPWFDCDELAVIVVQDQCRALTSVAHELGHLLGRLHAGFSCPNNPGGDNGDSAEHWAGGDTGRLLSVGVDRRTLGVLFDDNLGGVLGTFYDFMSYCASTACNDPDAWISVSGWTEEISAVRTGFPGANVASLGSPFGSVSASQVATIPTLEVQAFVDRGNTFITKVAPSGKPPTNPSLDSPYHLVALDRSSKILSDTGMKLSIDHIDDALEGEFLRAVVPAAGVAAVEIRGNGAIIARRVRSKHAPKIMGLTVEPDIDTTSCQPGGVCGQGKIAICHIPPGNPGNAHTICVSPNAVAAHLTQGDHCGPCTDNEEGTGTPTIINWTARDADHDPLTAKADYSNDGGQTWRPLFFGPNQNGVVLGSALFTHSDHARVRLRVNDGFNEVSAISEEFKAAGAPPSVHILSPIADTSIRSAAALYLSGQAFDDSQRDISGDSLSWYVGNTLVGTGQTLSVSGSPVGTTQVSLVARDSQGRTTTKSVAIHITP
jgi:hypothetical protein